MVASWWLWVFLVVGIVFGWVLRWMVEQDRKVKRAIDMLKGKDT